MRKFNDLNISTKIGIIVVFVVSIVFIGVSFNSQKVKSEIAEDSYDKTIRVLKSSLKDKISEKNNAGLIAALQTSEHGDIKFGLDTEDRDLVLSALDVMTKNIRENSKFTKIKVHIHDKEIHSFLRAWKPEKFGDDLSSFRHTILKVKESNKPLVAVEVGRAGMVLRSLAPINDDFGYLGSVEIIQGYDSVYEDFSREGVEFVAITANEHLAQSTLQDATDERKLSGYFVSQPRVNADFMTAIRDLDIKQLQSEGYMSINGYFVTSQAVNDFKGNEVGFYLLAQKSEVVEKAVDGATALVNQFLLVLLVVVTAILIILFIIYKKFISQPIADLARTIARVENEGDFSLRVDVKYNDDIGRSSKRFNKLIQTVNRSLDEVNNVVSSMAGGDFNKRIESDLAGDLGLLKEKINTSCQSIANTMDILLKAMDNLALGNFDSDVETGVGGFAVFTDKAKAAMDMINKSIFAVNEVMSAIAVGDFSKRVDSEVKGHLLFLKNNVNFSMDDLEAALSEINESTTSLEKGDLSVAISGDYKGQLAEMQESFNASVQHLKEMVGKIRHGSNNISSGVAEISEGASDLSQRTEEQASSLEETASSMEEMTSTVKQTADNSSQANQLSMASRKQADTGSEVVEKTIEAMGAIDVSSRKIAEIITVIDGIAFQTNLLALNAAVEAARAGEHGRGFAVVAGEVRNLAGRSAEAAKEVKELIEESVNNVKQGGVLVNQAGDSLVEIMDSVKKVNDIIAEIAAASNEQYAGIEQVNKAIAQMEEVTQQNASLVEESAAASKAVSDQAKDMDEMMEFFALGDGENVLPQKDMLVDNNKSIDDNISNESLKKENDKSNDEGWDEF